MAMCALAFATGAVSISLDSRANPIVSPRVALPISGARIWPSGANVVTDSVLFSFIGDIYGCKGGNGAFPSGGVISDSLGALYGLTNEGDAVCSTVPSNNGFGVVYKLTPSGGKYAESVVHSFLAGTDGAYPQGALIGDSAGGLYGTTGTGGAGCKISGGCGTVFKLTPTTSGYSYELIYAFKGGTDGAGPSGGLVADKNGSLYGLTGAGGAVCTFFGQKQTSGCGVVFKLARLSANSYKESVLYRFGSSPDGVYPQGPLAIDAGGALYGTAQYGGSGTCGFSTVVTGCGAVFKLTPVGSSYSESLYSFPTAAAGQAPEFGVILDTSGAIYGTTYSGGNGYGVVFKLTPKGSSYTERILYSFQGASGTTKDGAYPLGGLLVTPVGIYGTTGSGGVNQSGTVFELVPSGANYRENIIYNFKAVSDGGGPIGNLIADKAGFLYGVTEAGGVDLPSICSFSNECGGTVFKLRP
jgi:hypothetical protein